MGGVASVIAKYLGLPEGNSELYRDRGRLFLRVDTELPKMNADGKSHDKISVAENRDCFVEITVDLQGEDLKGTSTQSITHWAFDREGQLYPRSDAGVACVPSEYSDSGKYIGEFRARPRASSNAPIENYYEAYQFAQPLDPAKMVLVQGALHTLGYIVSAPSDPSVVDDALIHQLKEADGKTLEVGDYVSIELDDQEFSGKVMLRGALALIVRNEQNELLILRKRGNAYQAISKEELAYYQKGPEFVGILGSAKRIINDDATIPPTVKNFQEIPKK